MTFEYQFLLRKILQGKISCRSKEKPAENKFDIIPVHTTSEEFENKAFFEPRPEEVHDPLIFLDFIPCSLLINALFTLCSLDPQKCLSLFAIFVCLFCLSIYSRKKIAFEPPLFSLWDALMPYFIGFVSVNSVVSAASAYGEAYQGKG